MVHKGDAAFKFIMGFLGFGCFDFRFFLKLYDILLSWHFTCPKLTKEALEKCVKYVQI